MDNISNLNRKLHLDYHMLKHVTNIAEGFDAAKFADDLANANVQAVSAFLRCGGGYRYYRKGNFGTIHPNLPDGIDMVEDTIRECHKRGIKVIGYCSAWHSEPHLVSNDNCMKTRKDGSTWREICGNSPVFSEEILPQFTEIAANYDLDAIFFDCIFSEAGRTCYCEHCERKFFEDTGVNGIPKEKDDPNYETYIQWHNNLYKKYRKMVIDAVRKGNKNLPISINWQNVCRSPEEIIDDISFLSQDTWPKNIIGCEQTQAKNWAFSGKPFSLMNNLSPQWWMSYETKPVTSLIQEAMVPVINGGSTWTGFQLYQNYSMPPYVIETIGEVFGYIKNVEGIFENKQIVPHIAVLNGVEQLKFSRKKGDFDTVIDDISLIGINKALTMSGIPYNSMIETDLIKHIDRFKLIIVANNQFISDELYGQLKEFVKNGGKLIITGKSGSIDSDGNLVKNTNFEDLTGVEVVEEKLYPYLYIKPSDIIIDNDETHMPILCADKFTFVKNISAHSLAKIVYPYTKNENAVINWSEFPSFSAPFEVSDFDAITVNAYGKGSVVYLGSDLFKGYVGTNNWRMKLIIKNIINDVLLKDDAIITTAPNVIEMTIMQNITNGNLLVNFLNTMAETVVSETEERYENSACETILPVCNFTVKLPLERKTQSA
ncbi:MAG: hypothetical protein E7531_06875 [Ruminococcaceae bacterium]|nr:hypothetical protein [Oscillospiraceae bacterium]